MHTMSVRAVARRTSLAAAAATAAILVAPAAASAMPAPTDDVALTAIAEHEEHVAELRAERREERREERRALVAAQSQGEQILDLAANEAGDPYVYGAAGPDSFDCSGFTQYVFRQVGISLPRTAEEQRQFVTPVSDPQPGDLVFFGAPATHMGIYAGDGKMWDSPRTGKAIALRDIWSSNVTYGRP